MVNNSKKKLLQIGIYFIIGAIVLSIANYILLKNFDPIKCTVIALISTGVYFSLTKFKKKTNSQ